MSLRFTHSIKRLHRLLRLSGDDMARSVVTYTKVLCRYTHEKHSSHRTVVFKAPADIHILVESVSQN